MFPFADEFPLKDVTPEFNQAVKKVANRMAHGADPETTDPLLLAAAQLYLKYEAEPSEENYDDVTEV